MTRIVPSLLVPGVTWTDTEGCVPIGTVDKSQGPQAPVVVYSMASSSAKMLRTLEEMRWANGLCRFRELAASRVFEYPPYGFPCDEAEPCDYPIEKVTIGSDWNVNSESSWSAELKERVGARVVG